MSGQSIPTGGVSRSRILEVLIYGPDRRLREDRRLTQIALWTGIIFIPAGLVKFVFHHWELHAFHSFGLPLAPELEILAGVLETVGGVLLIMRRWLVPNAILLSATMIVAIVASGILKAEPIPSLTLAPALLIACVYLLARTVPVRTAQST